MCFSSTSSPVDLIGAGSRRSTSRISATVLVRLFLAELGEGIPRVDDRVVANLEIGQIIEPDDAHLADEVGVRQQRPVGFLPAVENATGDS